MKITICSKCFFIVVLFSFVYQSGFAQRFSFGMSAGIINSQFDGDKLFGFKKIGPTAGLNWYYSIDEEYQIEFDFDFINIGSKYSGETRPIGSNKDQVTLLEIDMRAVSFFTGFVFKLDKNISGIHQFRLVIGPRITKSFRFRAHNLSFGRDPVKFNENSLNTTIIGPELKFGFTLTPKISINLMGMISLNNMIVQEEFNVTILRPFYYGVSTSYVFGDPTEKLKRKSKKKRRRR